MTARLRASARTRWAELPIEHRHARLLELRRRHEQQVHVDMMRLHAVRAR